MKKLIQDILLGAAFLGAAGIFPPHATEHAHHKLALITLAVCIPAIFASAYYRRSRARRRAQPPRQSSGFTWSR